MADRKIVLAEVAGVCFGVRRALKMAEQTRAEQVGPVTCLGPIVHNEQVVSRLAGDGIGTVSAVEDLPLGTAILSAHGVSPFVLGRVRQRGLRVVDVTCPFVTKVHRAAVALHREGFQVLLLGDAGHSEVKGVIGAVEAACGTVTVVGSPEEIPTVKLARRVGLVSQTTRRADEFEAAVAALCRRVSDVRVINTICGATDALQDAARRMAAEVEVAIVIGGTSSANTRRLRQLCEEAGIPAYQVQTAEDVREDWLEGKSVIGVTAGASTPDELIEDVVRRLNGGSLPEDWSLRHPDE